MEINDLLKMANDFKEKFDFDSKFASIDYASKAAMCAKEGNYGAAIENSNKAIELNPGNVEAYWCKGFVLEQLGKYKEAIENYERVLAIKPSHYDVATRRNTIILNMPTNEKEEYKNDKLKEFDKLLNYGFTVPFSDINKDAAAGKLKQKMLNDINNKIVNAYNRIEAAVKEPETNYEFQIAQCDLNEYPIIFIIYYYITGKISPDTASTLLLYCARKMDSDTIEKFGNVIKAISPEMDIMFACKEFLLSLQHTLQNPSTTIEIWTMPNQYKQFKDALPNFLADKRREMGDDKFINKYYFVEYLKEYRKLFE